jgi:hypothetical protein
MILTIKIAEVIMDDENPLVGEGKRAFKFEREANRPDDEIETARNQDRQREPQGYIAASLH